MNWEPVIIAVVAALPPTLVAAAALVQAMRTRKAVDGRMTELLELTRKGSADAATLKEKETQEVKESLKVITEKTAVIAENGTKPKVPDTIVVDEIHAEKIVTGQKPTKGKV